MALRQVKDTPTNNFATLNPLQKDSSISLSYGNLRSSNGGTTHSNVLSTLRANGQNIFYVECIPITRLTGANAGAFYWARDNFVVQGTHPESSNSGAWGFYCSSGPTTYANGAHRFANFVAVDNDNTIIQLVYNSSTGEGWVGVKNTFYNKDENDNINSGPWAAMIGKPTFTGMPNNMAIGVDMYGTQNMILNFGQNPDFFGERSGGGNYPDANGQGKFYYEPPAGALALCSRNIQSVEQDGSYVQNYTSTKGNFRPVFWKPSGTGMNIPLGFNADLVWTKRTNGTDSHRLYDSIRGEHNDLVPSNTNRESSSNYGLGFVNGNRRLELDAGSYFDNNGNEFVAWCWKAAGNTAEAGKANLIDVDGTVSTPDISSFGGDYTPHKMSINREAGFSIIHYTGLGNTTAVRTLPHGLNKKPDFAVFKVQTDDLYSWRVYHRALGVLGSGGPPYMLLEGTNDVQDYNYAFGDVEPDHQYFTVQDDGAVQATGQGIIGYIWTALPGYSAFGGYVGNGSADGPFVYTGFHPAFVIIKQSRPNGQTSGNSWWITDSARYEFNGDSPNALRANSDASENTGNSAIMPEYLSNGFKIKGTDSAVNAPGSDYIYMAFAEQPGAFSNAG